MNDSITQDELLLVLDQVEKRLLAKKKHEQYCKVREEGTPYQSTSWYMISYVDINDIKRTFADIKSVIGEEE